MKTTKLIKFALCAAVIAAFGLVGCEKLETYSIDAPSDLQNKIDSIAAVKASKATGDTTFIDIATGLVGAEDNSAAWFTAFSDYFAIPTNKLLHLEFINFNGGSANNWNNWNLAISNFDDRDDADNYSEYFVMRSDAYGWGNEDFDLGLVTNDYPDTDGDEDVWNDFRTTMDGATVTLEIDHSATGYVFLTATAVGTNGTVLTLTYNQPVSATEDIFAFLICDASHFEMKQAFLLPSKVSIIEDVNPDSLVITGTPSIVEIGNTNFWGNAIATVFYDDGSSAEVDSADLTFTVVPDMTSLGTKTIGVAYSKTKQGDFNQAVISTYTLDVTNPVSSMEITTLPDLTDYYFFNSDSILFDGDGLVITATYSDGTTGIVPNESLNFSKIPAVAGAQNAVISYFGANDTVSINCPLTLIKGVSQVGADINTGWWTEFTPDYTVASGASKTFKMQCFSNGINNWHSPATILRQTTDSTENAVVRMDSFGWGTGYDGNASLVVTNDWDFDVFAQNINGSIIVITVTNNGDNTADINYDVTYANGDTHFQKYEGIIVDSSNLNCALVLEGAYLVITE